VHLDINLLKPFRVAGANPSDSSSSSEHTSAVVEPLDKMWLEYAYRKTLCHPELQVLPTKLAEWIGENMQDELGFPQPDKRDPNKYSVYELNNILRNHLVRGRNSCSLRTFRCAEWES
jgi:hypothetical protein